MTYWSFEDDNLKTVSDALHIAEDKTGDFYKFSFSQWKRHRYDVKTQSSLSNDEITTYAFALLNKCSMPDEGIEKKKSGRDFYMICLQDHQILQALKRDSSLNLLPLLVYIFTHELIHIVRFCNFYQRFDISGKGKESEERVVHETTYKVLKELSLPRLDYILESYQSHRICDFIIQ
jgi:hypothetical protein